MSGSAWPVLTLGDLLTQVKRPVELQPNDFYGTLGVRWYGNGAFTKAAQRGSEIAAKTLNEVRTGDVVYSKLFAWKGSFGTVPPDLDGVVASNEFPTYLPADGRLVPAFFTVWASRPEIWDEADLASTGTTANSRNRLATDDFEDFEIALPPVDVQLRIVRAVRALDTDIAAAQRASEAAHTTFQAMALDVFERLECDWHRLGDVTRLASGGTPPRKVPGNFGGTIPWVKTGEVRFNRLGDAEEYITEHGLSGSSAKLFPVGTVLLAMYGQGATRGRCALMERKMATNQACAAILPCEQLLPEFIFYFLWSRYETIRAESEGSAQDNLNKGQVADIEVPVPDHDAQQTIVDALKTMRVAVDAHDAKSQTLQRLRVAVIEELLGGSYLPDW